jgi:hypothetical protein
MMEPLKTLDVAHILYDNKELKKQFAKVVCSFPSYQFGFSLISQTLEENCEIEGWISSKSAEILGKLRQAPRVIGPSENISAVIVNCNWGFGLAKIVYQGREYGAFHTHSNGEDEAVMIFLHPGYYCVLTGNTHVKYIVGTGKL